MEDQAAKLRNIIKQNAENENKTARVITVTSGKGGVGKSNVAVNLGVELSRRGKKVIIFDADFGLANVEVMFGAVPKHNLADLIYKGKSIREIITTGPNGIGFISGGCGIAQLSHLTGEQIDFIVANLAELDKIADIVIIDTGAGISKQVIDFIVASGEVLLVTTPEPTSITDSYSLLKALSANPGFDMNRTQVKMIANRVEDTRDGQLLYQKLNAVVARYLHMNMGFLGVIPYDPLLSKAVLSQTPICIQNSSARSSRAFASLVDVLLDSEKTQKEFRRGMAGFFSSFIPGKRNF